MTLSCLPTSICSWDYCIVRDGETLAILRFKSLTEQGSIEHNGHDLEICKRGMLSGQWALILHGEELLTAEKPSAFSRSFVVRSSTEEYEIVPRALSRTFVIKQGDLEFGNIEPMHCFTRRATMTALDSTPTLVQLFAFWIVAMQWRRQHNSS